MAGKKEPISPERLEQIKADARSGRPWGEGDKPAPACICGAGSHFHKTALSLKGTYGIPTGMCHRHPGGSVWAPPLGLWEEIKEKGNDRAWRADS